MIVLSYISKHRQLLREVKQCVEHIQLQYIVFELFSKLFTKGVMESFD